MLAGALVALTIFRICGDRRRLSLKQSWSAAVLDALGIELEADLTHLEPGVLLVANHVSWLDIFVINAAVPSAFVSKEEVRRWPVIGWLAEKNDTVFLRRGSRGHARIVNGEISRVPQLIRQVTDFIRHDSKALHYKSESCCVVVGFFTPSA